MQRGKQVISRLNDFEQYSIMYQTYHTKDRIGRLSKYNFGNWQNGRLNEKCR